MKLIWCPESATKAYMAAVKTLANLNLEGTDTAELISALAGGWKPQLIVEAWAPGDGPATSIGLAAAVSHTRARHVCIFADHRSEKEYKESMASTSAVTEVVVRETESAMEGLEGVEMMVVDFRRRDTEMLLRLARVGPRGVVVVCKNWDQRRGEVVMAMGTRVVRSAFLPIGRGVEILHVGVGKGPRLGGYRRGWVRHVDKATGEEHVFRR